MKNLESAFLAIFTTLTTHLSQGGNVQSELFQSGLELMAKLAAHVRTNPTSLAPAK